MTTKRNLATKKVSVYYTVVYRKPGSKDWFDVGQQPDLMSAVRGLEWIRKDNPDFELGIVKDTLTVERTEL